MDQYWIDVGGTFTDCFRQAQDGTLTRVKILSTGAVRGTIDRCNADRQKVHVRIALHDTVPGGVFGWQFWRGWQLRLLDQRGSVATAATVVGDEADGCLTLDGPLAICPGLGQAIELISTEPAPVVAIRLLSHTPPSKPPPPAVVRLGTTRGTNALLTRRGAKTAFVTTAGLGDSLRIGYQNRPQLFALQVSKPEPLHADVLEIDERLTDTGQVLTACDEARVREQLAKLRQTGIESLAICLLHGYAHPQHEQLVERIAREVGFTEVSVGHRVAPLIKLVSRGDTTLVDAYLNPVLRSYVQSLRVALPGSDLRLMTSAGGLVSAERFTGKDSILSGPAGGVAGFSRAARAAGYERAIGFDMGGTSTDVARFDGRFELEYETEKAGVRMVTPMLAIHTVAAGGGSICAFDGVKLTVGPDSAAADPGPACYGRGGPLCLTDVNFFLGRLRATQFPWPLDRVAVERRLAESIEVIAEATGHRYTADELCAGYLRVANANMVNAIRAISVARGYDPRTYVLVAFGGAGPQHACAVARELGMREALIPPDASLLSAYGIGRADVVRHRFLGVYQPFTTAALAHWAEAWEQLAHEAREEVRAEGLDAGRIQLHRSLDLRYRGVEASLTIDEPSDSAWLAAFERAHEQRYGYLHPERELELVALRVVAIGQIADDPPADERIVSAPATPTAWTACVFARAAQNTAVFQRAELRPGHTLRGPALVIEDNSVIVIEPEWHAEVLHEGALRLVDHARLEATPGGTTCDPILLEILNNQFAAIAEQMGITLRNTASSVNVKERLDFSCALFTATGALVVNAPHIPVHLGAMGETVRCLIADNPVIQPGDVFVTNDPYRGGSHLPDLTVITPVHDADGRLVFFTASRAHHAEIGGTRPGSMPPFSRSLAEEGTLIRNFKLLDAGQPKTAEFRALLVSGRYPSRKPDDNLADVAAQVAANRQGARNLQQLCDKYSLATVLAYMQHVQDAAACQVRAALLRLPQGRRTFVDQLDDGSIVAVAITLSAGQVTIDFTGSAPVAAGNLNANRAIVTAAVMYVLRLLLDDDVPLNQGVLVPVTIVLPPGLLNPSPGATPETSPAVVGGNVETSQRIVDVLLGAFGLAAASQGTMNNTLFGDETFGYYETIGGGTGATEHADGCDAVHSHMTNTRLTDPEVLESRYPVRLLTFAIRRGSGGAGGHRGGDGIVRELEFLRALEVSLLHQRRGPYAPYGAAGGASGALGRNTLVRANGRREVLPGVAQFQAEAGDRLLIETPGGGGWGAPAESNE